MSHIRKIGRLNLNRNKRSHKKVFKIQALQNRSNPNLNLNLSLCPNLCLSLCLRLRLSLNLSLNLNLNLLRNKAPYLQAHNLPTYKI